MPAIFLGMAGIFIPVAMYMVVESTNLFMGILALIVLVFGSVFLGMAVYITAKRESKRERENRKDRNQLKDILEELKGL